MQNTVLQTIINFLRYFSIMRWEIQVISSGSYPLEGLNIMYLCLRYFGVFFGLGAQYLYTPQFVLRNTIIASSAHGAYCVSSAKEKLHIGIFPVKSTVCALATNCTFDALHQTLRSTRIDARSIGFKNITDYSIHGWAACCHLKEGIVRAYRNLVCFRAGSGQCLCLLIHKGCVLRLHCIITLTKVMMCHDRHHRGDKESEDNTMGSYNKVVMHKLGIDNELLIPPPMQNSPHYHDTSRQHQTKLPGLSETGISDGHDIIRVCMFLHQPRVGKTRENLC